VLVLGVHPLRCLAVRGPFELAVGVGEEGGLVDRYLLAVLVEELVGVVEEELGCVGGGVPVKPQGLATKAESRGDPV
jgi:hypothetical protein